MTTAAWSTVLDHSSDAGFRAWGSELNTRFASVGLVQTADTGQINWTTVTRAGTNTAAGYETWRTSDSSLFFKVEYGTGNGAAIPGLWITVGTGTNGSGTLTGQTSTRTAIGTTTLAVSSTVTNYQSYLCATAAFFGLSWKIASGATTGLSRALWAVGRTTDNTGTPSNVGYYVLTQGTGGTIGQLQTVRTLATAQTRAQQTRYCTLPGFTSATTTSSDGTNNQAFVHFLDTPGIIPALYTATVLGSDIAVGATISITLVGSTPHTYLCATASASAFWDASGLSTPVMGLIFLWE